jgi:DNA-binding GntR family transcriptional regulator
VIKVTVDHRAEEPPYLQLAGILRARIASGELAPGVMIPSITTLSQEYGVAVSTVRRSLGVLKAEGLIRTRPSWGTFVVPEAERPKN